MTTHFNIGDPVQPGKIEFTWHYCSHCGHKCEEDSTEVCIESGRRNYFSECCQADYRTWPYMFTCDKCDLDYQTKAECDACDHVIEE